MSILSNSAKFYAGRTVLPAYDFVGHNGLYLQHISFGGCDLLKIFGDWKYAWNYGTVAYCRLGNARQALSWQSYRKNYHPSSLFFCIHDCITIYVIVYASIMPLVGE